MAIKDKIVKWFIENIVIPQQEIMDKPGFIVEAYNKASQEVFLRELVIPEEIIVNVEKNIVKKFGKRGKACLYSAGKMFGYSYASRSFFPQITTTTQKEFESFVYMWIRYVEATSFGKIDYEFDRASGKIKLLLFDFMICPQNGMGYFITSGSFAGFWAFLLNDYTIEGIQTKCRGRGDPICEEVAGPKKFITQKGAELITSKTKCISWNGETERSINAVRSCRFNSQSLKELLDNRFFKYERGILIKDNKRYFILESSAMYFLESELLKIDKSNKILFNISFECGKSLFERNETDYEQFIQMFLSAMGYGDICVFKKQKKFHVSSDYFPWTPYADKISFAYFRGILSGLLSGIVGKNIILRNVTRDTSQGFLRLELSE